jgi:hypothetical protein
MSLTKVSYAMIQGNPANVLDFGAVGDGSADDTTAIQTALDSGAGVVYLPPGQYKITDTVEIPANTWLQGAYGGGIKYNPANAVCKIIYDGSSTTAIKFLNDINGASASKLSNIVITQTSATANVIAIRVGDATDTPTYTLSTWIENILIYAFTGKGIYNYGSWNCTVNNVLVHGENLGTRTAIGFHFDNAASGATSCYLTNCFAEECDIGFEIGSTSTNRIYNYSSLINTYVDGCTTAYRFLGDGTSTRVIHAYNIGIELVDGGNAVLADGAYVVIDGLSMFANGTGFTDVIKATNNALLTIANNDFIPQSGFGLTNSDSIVTADNAVVRFLNGDVTVVSSEIVQINGGRVDVLSKDRNVYKSLERVTVREIDVTVPTRDLTYTGFSKYAVSTSAAANQAMAGTPIVNVSNIADSEIITFVNTSTTYEIALRTEDIVAGTGIVKHPDNTSGSGVLLGPQDTASFVKKADGKLYEIRQVI